MWPGDADLKAQRPRGRHIVGEHPVNVARLGSRCTADPAPPAGLLRLLVSPLPVFVIRVIPGAVSTTVKTTVEGQLSSTVSEGDF